MDTQLLAGRKALITAPGDGPGVVRTEMWEQLVKDLVEIGKFEQPGQSMASLAANMIELKPYSYPDDILGTDAYLASADSDYMTGQLIMIDGGMVYQSTKTNPLVQFPISLVRPFGTRAN